MSVLAQRAPFIVGSRGDQVDPALPGCELAFRPVCMWDTAVSSRTLPKCWRCVTLLAMTSVTVERPGLHYHSH